MTVNLTVKSGFTFTRKGYLIITLCFLIIVIASLKHVWSVFIPFVESEFKVSRSISVLPFSLLNLANIVGFLTTNYFKNMFGIKKLLIITTFLTSLGLALTALSPNIPFLILSFAFIYGLGHSFGYVIAVSLGIKWFHRHKAGIATGIIVSAYSFGILTLSPLTTYLIQYFNNWRAPLVIYCIFAFIIMLISTIVLEEPKVGNVSARTSELRFIEIIRSKIFILIALVLFLTSLFDGLIAGNFVPLVREIVSVDLFTASLMLSIYSVIALISRVIVGAVSERLGIFKTLSIIYTIASINAFLFMLYKNLPLILIGVSISALLFSTNITLSPLIASFIWGPRNLEITYGLMLTAIVCGVLVGPMIGSILRDLTKSYYPGITLVAIALMFGTLMLIYVTKHIKTSIIKVIR